MAGAMLYWAEGGKTGDMVDFSNSDPQMVKLFMAFLRQICGVAEKRLRAQVYGYSNQSAGELEGYWSEVTGIPRSQFHRAYTRGGNPHKNGRIMEHGLIKIRYYDKRLMRRILDWAGNVTADLLQLEQTVGGVPKRTTGRDCKSRGRSAFGGSNPPPSTSGVELTRRGREVTIRESPARSF